MRKQITVIECSRCKRIEQLDPKDTKDRNFSVSMCGSEPVIFEELCAPCLEIVGKLVEQITKPMEKKSPARKKKKDKDEKEKPALENGSGTKREGTAPPSPAPLPRAPRA